MRIQVIQHDPMVGPALIGKWAEKKEYKTDVTRLYLNEPYPLLHEFDMLVILGGRQGANDIADEEKKWIKEAIQEKKFMLALCLGAQIVSEVMGGKAFRNTHREVGWWDIIMDKRSKNHPLLSGLPDTALLFQYHQDIFLVPPIAHRIATNHICDNQGFTIGNHLLALQFHPEMDYKAAEVIM